MSTPAAARVPAALGSSRFLLFAGAALGLLLIVLLGGLAGGRLGTGTNVPSPVAFADIPTDYLVDYQRAATRYGVDWAVLAAIGKVECNDGRSQAQGCNP
ncbi:MAG: hypothetical protein ACRDLR_04820, partial [Gaiellaceae bacterium]